MSTLGGHWNLTKQAVEELRSGKHSSRFMKALPAARLQDDAIAPLHIGADPGLPSDRPLGHTPRPQRTRIQLRGRGRQMPAGSPRWPRVMAPTNWRSRRSK